MMDAPNPKRPRNDVASSVLNPNSPPSSNQSPFDLIVSSLLSSLDSSPSLSSSSSPPSIGRSFDRALDKALASASSSDHDRLVDRSVEIASLLLESTKRCFRKRASVHNSNSWSFPQEITVKVFSMLDKKSLMQAMACCTMFHKCAMDPSCYSHIELNDKNVDDGVVRTMIHRAGNKLRSLELGRVASPPGSTMSLLTGSFLYPLSDNNYFIGNRLRSVHLYDLRSMFEDCGIAALSACSNITDLKIVGLSLSDELFESLTTKSCRMIEHLFLESRGFQYGTVENSGLVEFVTSIPNLTSLTLIGYGLNDATAQILIEGSRKLEYMNLSRTSPIKGRFLRDLGHSFKDSPLKTLILRDCTSLKEIEVLQFLNSLLAQNLRFIGHIDVSNTRGLVCDGGKRSKKPNFPVEKLKEERPNVKFVADFTASLSRSESLLRGLSYVSDEEDGLGMDHESDNGWIDSDDDMADFMMGV